ncbi:uncharacterized protein VTP21DRAFT_8648 [Calcarisporiella thermophila]|uniref:uncharacterized protein n=1 Tax=Calcarisporiella thermophila TaxID=911321 RepID=UPI003743F192
MKHLSLLTFIGLLALLVIAGNAQVPSSSSSSPTSISTAKPTNVNSCAEQYRCGQDLNCVSQCAGVPSPTEDQINQTTACVARCTQANETNVEVQNKCVTDCINKNYLPTNWHNDTLSLNGTNRTSDAPSVVEGGNPWYLMTWCILVLGTLVVQLPF